MKSYIRTSQLQTLLKESSIAYLSTLFSTFSDENSGGNWGIIVEMIVNVFVVYRAYSSPLAVAVAPIVLN